jgi:[protein-PII] uridylyltransferase
VDRTGRSTAVGATARVARSAELDRWLVGLLPPVAKVALVAVGSLGRREPGPRSDLDLVLVHEGHKQVAEIADAVWYPIWNAKHGLDHSVRTVADAVAVAHDDVKASLGLLDARYVAGDRELAAGLLTAVRQAWRSGAAQHLAALGESTRARWAMHGELAFLLEGDLKEARGGLRDALALRGISYTQIADGPRAAVAQAYGRLLDVRDALHLATDRPTERMRLQFDADVSMLLALSDADVLARQIADDARTIAYAADTTWHQVDRWLSARRRRWYGVRRQADRRASGRPGEPIRRPLADGVVEQDDEVVLARDADPADPVLSLRVAASAATADLPISTHTLERLAAAAPAMPDPWPEAARRTLVTLLGAGAPGVRVWEAMDRHGIVSRWLPEWERVRSLPQRNPVHRFTVDRHLVECAAAASMSARRVDRPDLLLLTALLHDVGKGLPGDHSTTGAQIAGAIARRLGLPESDVEVVVRLVRHHLLLADTATRRDIADPVTLTTVVGAVGGDPRTLDLLHALTEADAAATGPAVWSDWKDRLVTELVERAHALLGRQPPPPAPAPPADLVELAKHEKLVVHVEPDRVVLVTRDGGNLLSRAAGTLALHRLEVHSADLSTVDGTTVLVLSAAPNFGSPPDPALLTADLRRAILESRPVTARLAQREKAYAWPAGRRATVASPPPRVLWLSDAATDATVLELRAADTAGLLHRVSAALESVGAPIRAARVSTLGVDAVDAFYLVGSYATAGEREPVERAVLAAAVPLG